MINTTGAPVPNKERLHQRQRVGVIGFTTARPGGRGGRGSSRPHTDFLHVATGLAGAWREFGGRLAGQRTGSTAEGLTRACSYVAAVHGFSGG